MTIFRLKLKKTTTSSTGSIGVLKGPNFKNSSKYPSYWSSLQTLLHSQTFPDLSHKTPSPRLKLVYVFSTFPPVPTSGLQRKPYQPVCFNPSLPATFQLHPDYNHPSIVPFIFPPSTNSSYFQHSFFSGVSKRNHLQYTRPRFKLVYQYLYIPDCMSESQSQPSINYRSLSISSQQPQDPPQFYQPFYYILPTTPSLRTPMIGSRTRVLNKQMFRL